jgi:orotate phosphoribosyltransferase
VTLASRVFAASYLTGTFVLRSGRTADRYFDKYRFESDPILLAEIVEELVPLLPPDIDGLAGLELGGIPLATVLSARTGLPAFFVRKQAKK